MRRRMMSKLKSLKPDRRTIAAIGLKEELNKLFYNKPKYKEEMEMLSFQYAQDDGDGERLGLHASSITGAGKKFCFREQVINILYMQYKLKNPDKIPKSIYNAFQFQAARNERNVPINLKRIFEEGHSIGAKWQRLFIRGGIGIKEDMDISRFWTEYDLSYTPDAIITLNGKKYVVEIKSMNKKNFDAANSHPSGRKQLRLYMYAEGIDQGFVLADCKDNSDFKIFPEFSPKASDPDIEKNIDLLEEIQRIKRKVIKRKKLPPCKCGKCYHG
jgi:CRISPR/Cas system-associated exonuclease Cas4 (RecB family)